MSLKIVQEKLAAYDCRTAQEEVNALKEITQDLALAALARANFFKAAVFQGGTCLRILYGLDRFSEDLDFVLQRPDPSFSFAPFMNGLKLEFQAYGYHLEINDRLKSVNAVKKIPLKDDSIGKVLTLSFKRPRISPLPIKVKLEVDTNPPAGGTIETKYLDFPYPFAVIVQDPPSLFAGKMHALLCREYVKGRDWYDFVWYIARNTTINFALLRSALEQQGPWKGQTLTIDEDWLYSALKDKIQSIDWVQARKDVERFLQPRQLPSIELWSVAFFLDRLEKLKSVL